MGKAVGVLFVQPHHLQQLQHPLPPGLARIQTMNVQPLRNGGGHHGQGIEGGVGVLKNHLHVLAVMQVFLPAKLPDVPALIQDLPRVGLVELHDGAAQGGFAAAAFSHQAQGFPLPQGQADTVHGGQGAAALDFKGLAQVLRFQQNALAHG